MANFNKSFNFRNGVQVDNDNFVINNNGLVGIGTSIPTQLLDVYGNAQVSGATITNEVISDQITTRYIDSTEGGTVVGVLTATRFEGSALGLTDIFAIAVDGWHVTSGGSFISTTSSVGIGTDTSDFKFEVNGDVAIGSTLRLNDGHIIINAFDGIENTSDITGDSKRSGIGFDVRYANNGTSVLGALINTTLDIDNCDLNFNVREQFSQDFPEIPLLVLSKEQNVGIGTDLPSSKLYVQGNGYYTGIVTASSFEATTFVGDLSGTASVANDIEPTADVSVNSIDSQYSTSGVSTITDTLIVDNQFGLGTDTPNSQLHIRKNGESSLQLTSDGTNQSTITFGRLENKTSNNAQLRYGSTDGSFPDSNDTSLDIINYSNGDINFYLNPGGAGSGSLKIFNPALSEIFTVTNNGYLGLNDTNPNTLLSVNGNADFFGVSSFDEIIAEDSTTNNNSIIKKKLAVSGDSIPITYDLQVGNDPQTQDGVGISSLGNIKASGDLEIGGSIFADALSITDSISSTELTVLNNADIQGTLTAANIDCNSFGSIVGTDITLIGGSITASTGTANFNQVSANSYGDITGTSITLSTPGTVSTGGTVNANSFVTAGYSLYSSGIDNGNDNNLSFSYYDQSTDGGLTFNIATPDPSNVFSQIDFILDGTDLIINVAGIGSAIIPLS
jgi:hypothetical protein